MLRYVLPPGGKTCLPAHSVDGNTHPLVDVHLQRVVVEREEVGVRAASLVTKLVLQPKARAHTVTVIEGPPQGREQPSIGVREQ